MGSSLQFGRLQACPCACPAPEAPRAAVALPISQVRLAEFAASSPGRKAAETRASHDLSALAPEGADTRRRRHAASGHIPRVATIGRHRSRSPSPCRQAPGTYADALELSRDRGSRSPVGEGGVRVPRHGTAMGGNGARCGGRQLARDRERKHAPGPTQGIRRSEPSARPRGAAPTLQHHSGTPLARRRVSPGPASGAIRTHLTTSSRRLSGGTAPPRHHLALNNTRALPRFADAPLDTVALRNPSTGGCEMGAIPRTPPAAQRRTRRSPACPPRPVR